MTGSWHVYRERERWQRGAHLARAVVGADSGWVAVCFQAPVVETFHEAGSAPRALATLGPDLCMPAARTAEVLDEVLDEVLERVTRVAPAGTTLGEALLDQRIAAGIGNVYKSEACFAVGLDPATPIEQVDAAARRGCGRWPPASSRPTWARPSVAPTPPAWRSTAAGASPAPAAAPPSGWLATATRPAAPTGAPPANPHPTGPRRPAREALHKAR